MRLPAAEELRENLRKNGIYGPNVDKVCEGVGAILDRMWVDFEELLARMQKDLDDHRDWGG
jgi:hypothetical protein